MKVFLPFTVIVMLLMPFFISAETPRVSIYSDADQARYGQTFSRGRRISFELPDFRTVDTIDAPAGGIQTAVIADARVKNAIEILLEDKNFIFIENSVLTKTEFSGKPAYGFNWNEYGFEIVFSFEKADQHLDEVIEQTYSKDSYLLGELRRSYADNYAVRIYRADDIVRRNGKLDFSEAMLAATVIGDSFQPLFGIHDGLAVLNDIGLVTARVDVVTEGELVEYRDFETAGREIRSFIHTVQGMHGDFVDNLYTTVSGIYRKQADNGELLLPEEFFLEKKGDDPDFALFYYDILKRAGYEVKFIVIDRGEQSGGLYSTVFFKERGTDLWGWIDGQMLEREKASRISRLPALVFSGSVKYFEPDTAGLFSGAGIQLPPPSKWRSSLY